MDISTALATIKSSIDLVGLLVNERDRQKAASIQIDLTDKLIQAQLQLSQVISSIVEKDGLIQTLTKRVSELEDEQSLSTRYKLTKVSAVGDFFAYQLLPDSELTESHDEPMHFLCQSCLDIRKQKSVLMFRGSDCTCPTCKTSFAVKENLSTFRRHLSRGVDTSGF